MLKKIIIITLVVGLSGLLIWGGVNRTLARTTENGLQSSESNARGVGGKGAETRIDQGSHDCEEEGANFQDRNEEGLQGGLNGYGRQSASQQNQNNGQSFEGNGNLGGYINSQEGGNGSGRGSVNGGGNGMGYSPLDEDEIEALHLALDDEYHALAVYQQVISDFGEVTPFVEIVESEARHIEALLKQFDKHGITVPENTWIGQVPSFDSIQAACQAGVEAELANVALYEKLFSMVDDPGLIQVFNNLSRASQESHLPEFQSCQ